jgi:putative spermidine/putrescine transport system substrate-binding protein
MKKRSMIMFRSLVILSAAVMISGIAGCGKSSQNQLVVLSWGGALQDAQRKTIFKPFEKKYGVKIIEASPVDYGKIKAMVQNGKPEYDVMNVDADFVPRGVKEGLLEKLDFNAIDKTNLDNAFTTEYSVAAEIFSNNISYNTKAYTADKHPKTWAEFWDVKKFPGARTMQKWPMTILEIALLADGVDSKKLYPLDVDRAFKSLDKIKPSIKSWWDTGAQSIQLLSDNEVQIGELWSGRVIAAQSQKMPVALEDNQSVLSVDSWTVIKGSKKKDLAMKFIAFATSAEVDAEYARAYPYGPVNLKAYDLLTKEEKDRLATNPDKRKNQVMIDVDWWFVNFDKVNERFQKWLLK